MTAVSWCERPHVDAETVHQVLGPVRDERRATVGDERRAGRGDVGIARASRPSR